MTGCRTSAVDRFVDEQLFEEDVRAVLKMMRPNRRERLEGWKEYRTGGTHFRVTVSWDAEFDRVQRNGLWDVPHLVDVLEALLVGSVSSDAELPAEQEFDLYRNVLRELYRRVEEMESCYR